MMAKKKRQAKQSEQDDLGFEESLERLEAAIDQLEDGRLPLDEALACYEQGVARLRRCHQLLDQAQQKIELLTGVDAEGRPITQPLQPPAH